MTGAGNRRKGNRAELALAKHLAANGLPHAERRGVGFAGSDIVGTPGLTWECKARERMALPEWVDQATAARDAAGDRHAIVVTKRRGTTDPGRWFAVLELDDLLALLAEAGWAEPRAPFSTTDEEQLHAQ